MVRLALILAVLAAPGIAQSAERIQICAKYQSSGGWSDGYKVTATKTTGGELNQATGSWDYDSFSTYIVIFWDRDEASVIKMDWPSISAIGTEGEDARGVRWEISTSSLCF